MVRSRKDASLQDRRRKAAVSSSSCSKSFARYCVALLGSLGLAAAAPIVHPISSSRIAASHSLEGNASHKLYARIQDRPSLNRAATIVGVCAGLAALFAIVGAVFFMRYRRQTHRRGKCKCGEKGVRCKYQRIADEDNSSGSRGINEDDEREEGRTETIQSRSLSLPSAPGVSFLSGFFQQRQPTISLSSDTAGSSGYRGGLSNVERIEHPIRWKHPPSSFRAQTPSASSDRLIPPSPFPNLLSPISPLLSHQKFNPDVSITPPRTPSPAVLPKPNSARGRLQLQNFHLRGRSLSAVDLSRSDGELQEDLTAIVLELQRRPRANSVEGRRDGGWALSASYDDHDQTQIMELEASPGMWDEQEQRGRGVVHEAVGEEFAVELDSRPSTLGLRRTRRSASRVR